MNLPLGTLQTSLAGASVSNPRLDIFGFWLEKTEGDSFSEATAVS